MRGISLGSAVVPPESRKNATSDGSLPGSGTGSASTRESGITAAVSSPLLSPSSPVSPSRTKIRRRLGTSPAIRRASAVWSNPRWTPGTTYPDAPDSSHRCLISLARCDARENTGLAPTLKSAKATMTNSGTLGSCRTIRSPGSIPSRWKPAAIRSTRFSRSR